MNKTHRKKQPLARRIHRETKAAWEIIAQAGYSAEVEEDVTFIRDGGVSLLPPEQHLLEGLETWCDCALQLQCSGGRDLLSIWNLGAKRLVGVDISETLIQYARQKSTTLHAPATWYCCDVLDTPHTLDGTADLVYTGRGALMWIMDLEAWASVVARLLSPHGRVVIFEGHPLDNLWQREADTFQLRPDGTSYFSAEPRENPGFPASVVIREAGDTSARPQMRERCWRPGEVINALAAAGLRYEHFDEYPTLFWNQFEHISADVAERLPHTYAVVMRKGNSQ